MTAKVVRMPKKPKDDPFNREKIELVQGVPARLIPSKKQLRQREHFVMVPLWWAERAAQATNTPKAYVWVWLLYRAWQTRSNRVVMSNMHLPAGVNRFAKKRALAELEAAGLIRVEPQGQGRAPVAILIGL
jgi:hypothetical protein